MVSTTVRAATSPDFVDRRSIVRRIWGDPDLVLLIFAGAAAEFALNRAVDWLFFTGEIPRDLKTIKPQSSLSGLHLG